MSIRLNTYVCLFILWWAPTYSGAADIDFDRRIVCNLDYLEMCKHGGHGCKRIAVVDLGGIQTFVIDTKEKWIGAFEGKVLVDSQKFDSVSVVNEVLYLHGTNPDSKVSKDGTGWLARVEKAEGKFSAASLADAQGYFLFGACHHE